MSSKDKWVWVLPPSIEIWTYVLPSPNHLGLIIQDWIWFFDVLILRISNHGRTICTSTVRAKCCLKYNDWLSNNWKLFSSVSWYSESETFFVLKCCINQETRKQTPSLPRKNHRATIPCTNVITAIEWETLAKEHHFRFQRSSTTSHN